MFSGFLSIEMQFVTFSGKFGNQANGYFSKQDYSNNC